MKKIYLTLFFTITLSSELILEITQGTENPFRVALLEFDGDKNISNQIDNIIKNNLKDQENFRYLRVLIYSQSHPMKVKSFLMILKF